MIRNTKLWQNKSPNPQPAVLSELQAVKNRIEKSPAAVHTRVGVKIFFIANMNGLSFSII
jgi:hypothetical protein